VERGAWSGGHGAVETEAASLRIAIVALVGIYD